MSGTPSIRISQHQRFSSPPRHLSLPAIVTAQPMAIPCAREAVPPPLPPPSHIPEIYAGHDPGWRWGNDPNGIDFGRSASVKPGSSLWGAHSMKRSPQDKEHDHRPRQSANDLRRGSSISTVTLKQDRDTGINDGDMAPSDEDGPISRPPSNHRYVLNTATPFPHSRFPGWTFRDTYCSRFAQRFDDESMAIFDTTSNRPACRRFRTRIGFEDLGRRTTKIWCGLHRLSGGDS